MYRVEKSFTSRQLQEYNLADESGISSAMCRESQPAKGGKLTSKTSIKVWFCIPLPFNFKLCYTRVHYNGT